MCRWKSGICGKFGLDADAAGLQLYRATSVGELYTYSVVWLGLAAMALTLGNWLGNRSLYKGGMVLLLVVVAKLFLIDMAGLTGLWRVASFMGLGAGATGAGLAASAALAGGCRRRAERYPQP